MAAKDMTDALQNPHPEVLFARGNFQTQSTTIYVYRASRCAYTGLTTPKPCYVIKQKIELSHAHSAIN
jgi:hypothetical protein